MIAQSVAEIISRHVRLTVEGIDRMYLNVFVPGLQYEQGIVQFFRTQPPTDRGRAPEPRLHPQRRYFPSRRWPGGGRAPARLGPAFC